MKNFKKVLSSVLALVLSASILPSTFAEGEETPVQPNVLLFRDYEDYTKGADPFNGSKVYGTFGAKGNASFHYCVVPQSQVYKIADTTSYEAAAMTEPVACCLHGIDMCNISCGDTVAVIGGGMIGMIMLQLAKISGAGKLIMIEPVAEKREIAKKLGADLCIDPINEDVKAVLSNNQIERISCVIECVGRANTMEQAIDIAGLHSVVMLFGLTAPDDVISVKPFEIFKKEIVLKASFINPYTQKRALELIDNGKIDVTSMVYACESLEKLPLILSDSKLRSKGKFIINPQI